MTHLARKLDKVVPCPALTSTSASQVRITTTVRGPVLPGTAAGDRFAALQARIRAKEEAASRTATEQR